MFLNAGIQTSSDTPSDNEQPFIAVGISQFSVADQTPLLDAFGDTTDHVTFSIAKDLSSAHAAGTVRVFDFFNGTIFNVTVDVSWIPIDAVVRDHGVVHEGSRGVHFFGGGVTNLNVSFTSRNALATGRVTMAGAASNLIPTPSNSAGLQFAHTIATGVTVLPPPDTPIDIVRTLDGASTTESLIGEQANAVRVDSQDNVVAAGYIQMFGSNPDFTVAKWSTANQLLWFRTLASAAHPSFNEEAKAVAIDSQNNVVAAGLTSSPLGCLFTVAKWTPDGTLVWQRNLHGLAPQPYFCDQATGVAVDGQDNVAAVGILDNTGDGQQVAFTVAKWGPQGNLLWTNSLGDSARPNAVAIDRRDSSIVAVGHTLIQTLSGPVARFVVAKWAADGTPRWVRTLQGTAHTVDDALSVAVDSQGAVLASGYLNNVSTFNDFTVTKWDVDGIQLWNHSLDGTQGFDQAAAVTVDSKDNVIAAGTITEFGIGHFTVAKWDPAGNELWVNIKNFDNMRDEPALAVAVDGNDNVIATGHNSVAMQTIKYDAAAGNWQWLRTISNYIQNSFPANTARAFSIAVDRKNHPVIGGFTSTDTDTHFTVAKPCANCP